jgi:hypothetical protein
MAFDIEMKSVRQHDHRVDKAREIVKRPLTLTEKILYNHLWMECQLKLYARQIIDLFQIEWRVKMQRLKWPYCNLCRKI